MKTTAQLREIAESIVRSASMSDALIPPPGEPFRDVMRDLADVARAYLEIVEGADHILERWDATSPEIQRGIVLKLAKDRTRLQAACEIFEANSADATELFELLREVYQQVGNEAPAEKRHVLTADLRDRIRDAIFKKK